ncbi:DUF4097 family beta strand repeat-containing protein [Alicyclobacillus fodiniaquatilis]|jgi:hypothetical protein|uniref:DUF4097 family beta strand repeat-containing protein n=1 Tax=Alicyclobacillus fodiniaquatilis TaxID=1661150 RepID=A0ABW4JHK1_9BACL
MIDKLILISCGLVAIGVGGLGYEYSQGRSLSDLTNQAAVSETKSVNMSNVQNLSFDMSVGDLHITPSNGNQLVVSAHGEMSKQLLEKMKLTVVKKGNSVSVSFQRHARFGIGLFLPSITSVDVDVEMPAKNYQSIAVDAGTADVSLGRTHATSTTIHDGTGDVHLSDVHSDLSVSTGTGDITMQASQLGQHTNLKAGTGDIEVTLQQVPKNVHYALQSGTGSIRWLGQRMNSKTNAIIGKGTNTFQATTGTGDITVQQG